LGHRHPRVTAAVHKQLDRLPISTRSLANPVTPALAARLVDFVGQPALTRCWFGANGTDAVECALKLARLATGRAKVLAVVGGFHGRSLGSLGATWSPRYRHGIEAALSEVVHLDPAKPESGRTEILRADAAALIFEPVLGEGGVVPLPADVLRTWTDAARA